MNLATVFDCFSGLGGLSLGAQMAGYKVLGGVDGDEAAVEIYSRMFPGRQVLHHNLLAESPRCILKKAGLSRGDVDVLVGGPPCQPYSVNNHSRGTHDRRCALVASYLGFVSNLRPEWLVMENVPGFASIENGEFLGRLLHALKARHYAAESLMLESTHFGVPQRRKRLVIIAGRVSAKVSKVVRDLLQQNGAAPSVSEALGDLPAEVGERVEYAGKPSGAFQRLMRHRHSGMAQFHVAPKLGQLNLARLRHVPPGGNWRNIPRKLLPAGMRRARLSDHTTRYGRLHPDRPAFTLLTKCDPHWGCFVHPTEDRVITVREAARLQSIPDRVEFTSSLTASYRLIGNAVPPLLAKGILEHLR